MINPKCPKCKHNVIKGSPSGKTFDDIIECDNCCTQLQLVKIPDYLTKDEIEYLAANKIDCELIQGHGGIWVNPRSWRRVG